MNKDFKHRLEARDKEIEKINEFYDIKEKQVRDQGKEAVINQSLDNNDALLERSQKNEERLTEIKNDLIEQENKLKDGFVKLQDQLKSKEDEVILSQKEKILQNNTKFENIAAGLKDRNQLTLLEMKNNIANDQISEIDKGRFQLASVEQANVQKYQNQDKNFAKSLAQNQALYKTQKDTIVDEHNKFLHDTTQKNLNQRQMIEENNQKVLQNEANNHKAFLLTQQKVFEERYQNLIKEHHDLLESLQNKNTEEIEKLKTSHLEAKRNISNKLDDNFYQLNELEPILKETEKNYEVTMKVPEHEKDTITLTGEGRSLTVTKSRRFQEKVYNDKGESNATARTEFYSKSFNVNQIIDDSKLLSKYEDGMLTFIVPKK